MTPSTSLPPIDVAYAHALGTAVFAFARLEATAVRACEMLRPGSLAELDDRTAGRVADTLRSLCPDATDEAADPLLPIAERFGSLVRSRNNLLHAKPGIDRDGRTRLLRDDDAWSLEEVERIAVTFDGCEVALGRWIDEH